MRPSKSILLKVVILGKNFIFFVVVISIAFISLTIIAYVCCLGDGGVGKSCLMNRFVSNHFDGNSFHTIGVEFLNKDIDIDGEKYTLQVCFLLILQ